MWKKLEALMAPYETLPQVVAVAQHVAQLIGAFEVHRAQGEEARNAAIDAVIALLQAEKSKQ